MTRATHTHSYYAATAQPWDTGPRVAGDIECDVCVVGGGITGCSSALHLAERGYDVVLVEGNSIGWGASGRSGAQVIFGFARDIDRIARLVGAEDARRLWDLALEGVQLVKALIAKHGIACDWRAGQIHVAIKERQRVELREYQRLLANTYDYSLDLVEDDDLHTLLHSARYIAGLYDGRSGHLHPLNYTLGLAAAARRAGVRVFENSRVERYTASPTPMVMTATGRIKARQVVFAGNAYLANLVPSLARKIMPVGTYIVATEPLGEARAKSLIGNDMAVTDINYVLDYFRLSSDHRLLFGGRVSYTARTPRDLIATMRARMKRVFPQLDATQIDHAWGGLVDISFNRLPHFGRLTRDIYFAQGFSGHGIALTGLAGKLIAEAVAGAAERFDVFARIPHRDFPGGALFRIPALLLGTAYYRLRDLL